MSVSRCVCLLSGKGVITLCFLFVFGESEWVERPHFFTLLMCVAIHLTCVITLEAFCLHMQSYRMFKK